MTGRDWGRAMRAAADALTDAHAVAVVARTADDAARVALGIARVAGTRRRTAVADVTGDAAPVLAQLPPGAESTGIVDGFCHGVSFSAIAHPVPDSTGQVHLLPSGSDHTLLPAVRSSAGWQRLAAAFHGEGALLLVVCEAGAPGVESLQGQLDGVVRCDRAPVGRGVPLLAEVDLRAATTRVAEPADAVVGGLPRRRHPGTHRRRVAVAGALLLAAVGAGAALLPGRAGGRPAAGGGAPGTRRAAPEARPAGAVGALPPDTVTLSAPVNPWAADSAARFAVELVASNTFAGANSLLRAVEAPLPAATVAPVVLGQSGAAWYKVVVGAWSDRAAAAEFLERLRARGVVREGAGAVVDTPIALLLEEGVAPEAVPSTLATWRARGLPAYPLRQGDGSIRIFAGAFETTTHTALLAASLHEAGRTAVSAYRTGRAF